MSSNNDAAQRNYDIAVVGAGPAGLMAAWHAAKGGRRVCLLERKEKAGVPVRCGEGIGYWGLTVSLDYTPAWVRSTITRARFVSPGGITVHLENFEKSFILDREKMEADLVDNAIAAGADYFCSTPVLSVRRDSERSYACSTPRGDFFAPCVILADGVESRLARDCGWNTSLALDDVESCAFCRVEHESIRGDTVTFFVGSSYAPAGFAWEFPHRDGKANIGLGILGSLSEAGAARAYLQRFVDRFYTGGSVADIHCGGVPVAMYAKPLIRDGVMLAGDAARQMNCLSGAGIGYGLFAGKSAGLAAANAFTPSGCDYGLLKEYQRDWDRFLGKQQKRSYALKTAFIRMNDDRFFDRVARDLQKADPRRMGYMRVFLRAFARHPLLFFKAYLLLR
jgi:digeranylgeranylglycerophospholipid reductase